MTATLAVEDVLIIGAGPAGITSAYYLAQAGVSYKIVDRAEAVGSTWANLYPSLQLNTSRYFSHLPDTPFPRSYGVYATGKQYYAHLAQFVKTNNFNIELGVEVYRVAPEGNLWRVEMSSGTCHYKAVITATGIYGCPVMPDIPGMEEFTGELYHAHDFKDPAQVAGKRVLVVGNGPSGVDIAVASGDVARETYIAIRSGVKMKRRFPLGIAPHGWLLLAQYLPKGWCRALMKAVGSVGYQDTSRLGLKPPPPGEGGMTAYQGPDLIHAVQDGKVKPAVAPVRFAADTVEFADGQQMSFDTVIMATGYRPVLQQYLDVPLQYNDEPWKPSSACDWEIGPNGQRGWPLRDTSEHPNGRQIAGHPGLYLIGTFYKGKGAMFNMKVEAKIAAMQIKQYLAQWKAEAQGVPQEA